MGMGDAADAAVGDTGAMVCMRGEAAFVGRSAMEIAQAMTMSSTHAPVANDP